MSDERALELICADSLLQSYASLSILNAIEKVKMMTKIDISDKECLDLICKAFLNVNEQIK